jgi:protease-4
VTFDTETVLDRRRLRRLMSFWRGLAIVALIAAIGAIAFTAAEETGLTGNKQIARVLVEGLITDDRERLHLLKQIAEAKEVQALLVSVNSPGGTTTGGEALFEALREVAKSKPVVAQFGTVAASAAYIVGLACDHIVTRGNSITGSVGVIFQWAEVSQLLDKLGIKMNEIKSGPLKAVPSMFEPLGADGRSVTEQMVADSQRWFLGLVSSRRGINTAAVPGLEQGRIFSGREAVEYKLVDDIGGEAEAIKWLEDQRGVAKKLKVVDWKPKHEGTWSWVRIASDAASRLLGFGSSRFIEDPALAWMRLDGLVSVWHPAEK